jgi:electron transfer flavoprotein alpha subunit
MPAHLPVLCEAPPLKRYVEPYEVASTERRTKRPDMNMTSWVIVVDERRVNGMLEAARKLGGDVVAAVVGPSSLADTVAELGFDRVLCFETREDVPAEAYATQVGEAAKATPPRFVMASDAPAGRMLLGAVAARLNAPLVGAVRRLTAEDERVVVSKSTAEGKVWEDLAVQGALAVLYDGDDAEPTSPHSTPVELMPPVDPGAALRLIETVAGEEDTGLQSAARVVGVGGGLRAKDDLALIEELASVMHAEIGCSLPISEDMRWLPAEKIIGATHHQITPDLYLAIGISGQPVHMAGVRDAKFVVAINNDPEAKIFRNCDIGVVGDLYKVVPALISAFHDTD